MKKQLGKQAEANEQTWDQSPFRYDSGDEHTIEKKNASSGRSIQFIALQLLLKALCPAAIFSPRVPGVHRFHVSNPSLVKLRPLVVHQQHRFRYHVTATTEKSFPIVRPASVVQACMRWMIDVPVVPRRLVSGQGDSVGKRRFVLREIIGGAEVMLQFHRQLVVWYIISNICVGNLAFAFAPVFSVSNWNVCWAKLVHSKLMFALCTHLRLKTYYTSAFHLLSQGIFMALSRTSAWVLQLLVPNKSFMLQQFLGNVLLGPIAEEFSFRGVGQFVTCRMFGALRLPRADLLSRLMMAYYFAIMHLKIVPESQGLHVAFFRIKNCMNIFMSTVLMESRLAENRRCVWAAIGGHVAWNLMCYSCNDLLNVPYLAAALGRWTFKPIRALRASTQLLCKSMLYLMSLVLFKKCLRWCHEKLEVESANRVYF